MSKVKTKDWIKWPEGGSMVIENCNENLGTKNVKGIPRSKLYSMMTGYYSQPSDWKKYKEELTEMIPIYEKKLEELDESYNHKKSCIQTILWGIQESIKGIDNENRS